ncbi:MAG: hypothetical protein ABI718_00075 [Acidobacteriota bacterium]
MILFLAITTAGCCSWIRTSGQTAGNREIHVQSDASIPAEDETVEVSKKNPKIDYVLSAVAGDKLDIEWKDSAAANKVFDKHCQTDAKCWVKVKNDKPYGQPPTEFRYTIVVSHAAGSPDRNDPIIIWR